ncbi:uncharacterized protein LOC118763595 [Octopus sinensis]|uniref:Uncharacterized protein LOC118763595 n=1 Tax=Octopus sinensis TaxID=2607531 RepID=A0A7E6EUU7_9MOLL|nr:uncharacterized protein LOC118763595 [Octopus sinensis]
MESLIDKVDASKWEEIDASKVDGLVDYHIMRNFKNLDDHTIEFLIQANDDSDTVKATCTHLLKGKNPMQGIGSCEMKVVNDAILAINLNGDCIVLK